MAHTVLFVDDELSVLQALVRRLRKEPYEIRTATTAEEAWRTFERCTIDLVVSDWRMPGMSGTEFLAKVAAEYPDCIRIMLTGEPSLAVAIGAVNNGEVHRFLTKPYDADALAGIIREALLERDASFRARPVSQREAGEKTTVTHTRGEPVESRQFHDSVLAYVSDCVITVDQTGMVLEINPAAERTFRCRREDVLGRSVAEIFPCAVLRGILAGCVASSPSTGGEKTSEGRMETTAVLRDGTEIPVSLLTVTASKAGRPIFTSFIRDLSKLRATEAALKAAEAQLRQANEWEALGRFARGVAPELNKFVAAITKYCDSLLTHPSVAGAARELVRKIKKSSERAAGLTPRLLASSEEQCVAPSQVPSEPERNSPMCEAKTVAVSRPTTMERR